MTFFCSSYAKCQVTVFTFNNPAGFYFGDWTSTNSPVTGGQLVVGNNGPASPVAPSPSGGAGVFGLNVNISQETALQVLGTVNAGNAASDFQIILSDNTNNGSGNTASQASFAFSLAGLSSTSPSTSTLNYTSAQYYYSNSTTFAETSIPMSDFNFADITQISVQGDFSSSTVPIRFSLNSIQAVPEPPIWSLLGPGLALIGLMGFHLRRRISPSDLFPGTWTGKN